MSSLSVLVVPACERGRGGGHLSRSLLLLDSLCAMGKDAYLWIPAESKDGVISRFSEFFEKADVSRILSREEDLARYTWNYIVLDHFCTSGREFAFWSNFGPLIGIDEGGPERGRFDFLVDLLPSLSKIMANSTDPGLLPLPQKRRSDRLSTFSGRVLVSFGAEDSAGLGLRAAKVLASNVNTAHPLDITLVAAATPNGERKEIPGVNVIGKIPNLREHLAEYDLFITHFGLGAFEALYARVPVLLLSPTSYHEKLAKKAGFLSLGIGAAGIRLLKKLRIDAAFFKTLAERGGEIARCFGFEEDQKENFSSFIGGIDPGVYRNCPLCGNTGADKVIGRFPLESYRRCRRCDAIYLSRLKPASIEYGKDYFFDSYKKQYGKTYLEDFSGLKETGRKRLDRIQSIMKKDRGAGRLLDVGCAYGPFLAAAAENGFAPCGAEPAEDAVRYVREELGIPVWHGFFPDALPEGIRFKGNSHFDVVTLWYVIEHFEEPGKILGEIARLLKCKGVLAFSTPSFSGVSGWKNLNTFLKNSPPDHRTVWSPRSARRILVQYGFRVKKIVITGHHPERFPFFGRFVQPEKKDMLYRTLFLISRIFRLGDTFELYAQKE